MKRAVGWAVVGMLALAVTSGCDETSPEHWYASGGGFSGTTEANAKVTVGLQVDCSTGTPGRATVSFIDRRAAFPVSFRATGTVTCSLDGPTDPTMRGTYVARPRGGTGQATITIQDSGDIGRMKGDRFIVSLVGGPYAGYLFNGALDGGNLKATVLP